MELVLSWLEGNQPRSYTVSPDRTAERPVRLGRDPLRSEVILNHPTVSGLHVSIHYNPAPQQFILENLRPTNPAIVNGQKLPYGTAVLTNGTTVQLGAIMIKLELKAINLPQKQYGLKCPRCGKVSPYRAVQLVCPWCGTSLASAPSVIIYE